VNYSTLAIGMLIPFGMVFQIRCAHCVGSAALWSFVTRVFSGTEAPRTEALRLLH
jgi:hypothetical protein